MLATHMRAMPHVRTPTAPPPALVAFIIVTASALCTESLPGSMRARGPMRQAARRTKP
jgi:hypothetical protein